MKDKGYKLQLNTPPPTPPEINRISEPVPRKIKDVTIVFFTTQLPLKSDAFHSCENKQKSIKKPITICVNIYIFTNLSKNLLLQNPCLFLFYDHN